MEGGDLVDLDFVDDPFGRLTATEQRLVEYARLGKELDLSTGDADVDYPANADSWGANRTIRAEVVSTLCRQVRKDWPVAHSGLRIHGAGIVRRLDFDGAIVPVPLEITASAFELRPTFRDSHLRRLVLSGSRVPGLMGDGMHVSGGVYLRDGFEATGEVSLIGATIGGDLSCAGGTFNNSSGDALSCDRIRVTGAVFLAKGFAATGAVRLVGGTIGASLDCAGASFSSVAGSALICDRVNVAGSVFFEDGFEAWGMVGLNNANIGGNVQCDGGTFHNEGRNALTGDGLHVTGDLFLREGFEAQGEVRLIGVTIGGDLSCAGGTFNNGSGDALSCDQMQVAGSVYLRKGFRAIGTVRLHNASIGRRLECVDSSVTNPGKRGLILENAKAGTFFWVNVSVDPTTTISFRHAHIDVLLDSDESWPAEGHLQLDGFAYTRLHGNAPQKAARRLEWIRLDPAYRPQPYEQLISVYRAAAQDRHAREIAIAKQVTRRKAGSLKRWQRPFHKFFGSVGYGHKPYRAIWALAIMIFIGSIIYSVAQDSNTMSATRSETATANACDNTYPCLQSLLYSLDVTVPIVNLEQRTYWLPDTSTSHGRWVQYWMWFSILAGWALSTLFVAAVTGLIKRD